VIALLNPSTEVAASFEGFAASDHEFYIVGIRVNRDTHDACRGGFIGRDNPTEQWHTVKDYFRIVRANTHNELSLAKLGAKVSRLG
jgi:hypothetical protein